MDYSLEGCHYGEVSLDDKTLQCTSAVTKKRLFDLDLTGISQCVVPMNNADDLEIQFADVHKREKKEDCLVSITFHFPKAAEKEKENDEDHDEEEEEEESEAIKIQQRIMDSGVLKTTTSDVIVEFTKEQGNFTYPRGKYSLQFTPTQMVMQGAQYSFRVAYTNIEVAYMLRKSEDRVVFVLQLATAIRQGNQKYKSLVLETHTLEETITFSMPVETLSEQYGLTSAELTNTLDNIFGKVFKSIGGVKILKPSYESATQSSCVRCSIKASEGLLFPAARCFIFITKPTIIVKFEDIESIEFLRYDNTKNAATRNFDMKIRMKPQAKDGDKDYTFSGIYRSEYPPLMDFIESKEIPIINRVQPMVADVEGGDDDEDDEEDDDYNSDAGSDDEDEDGSGSGSGSGSDSEGGEESEEEVNKSKKMKVVTQKKEKKEKPEKKEKAPAKKRKAEEPAGGKEKKKRQKKDKNAPKRATTAFMAYSNAIRSVVQKENPGMKITDISKEIGARWKAMSSEDKVPYDEIAKKDKVRYEDEMKVYKQKGGKEESGDESS